MSALILAETGAEIIDCFYLREGLDIASFHFSQKLAED